MKNVLRPIDDRFRINNISMPRPHQFITKWKWLNKDAETDTETGQVILNPICRKVETTWKYKLLRDDQFMMIYNQVFQQSKDNYKKPFTTLHSVTFRVINYTTYEPDDFVPPECTGVETDGHRYYKNIEFHFTNIGGDI